MKSTPSKIFLGLIITAAILCLIYFSRQTTVTETKVMTQVANADSSEQTPIDTISPKLQNMSLEEKIGQMFLIGIYVNDSNTQLEKLITEEKIGSVMLMKPNITKQKVSDVTKRLRTIAETTNHIPFLISVDQEGGIVARIKDADSDLTSQPEIKNAEQAYDVALARGRELHEKGIDINFAPVLEYVTSSSSFLYERVFRGSKENIISLGESMVRGYRDAGIISTVKHFPGHDDTSVDSHKNLPVSNIDSRDLAEYTRTFREVIKNEKPPMVMTAHVSFPKIDPTYPATLSPILVGMLRTDLDYTGVIISDDMNMGAITKSFGVEKAAIQAVLAGNDILLYVATTETIKKAYRALISAVQNGQISKERIDESVYRILKLKESKDL